MKEANHGALMLAQAVDRAYAQGQTDYNLEPMVRADEIGKKGRVKPGDAVIFCCRRGEREVELTEAFTAQDFEGFERDLLPGLDFVIMTLYHEKFKHLPVAFSPSQVKGGLAETLSSAGLRQLHCAESEKFAHVTYFFNGGRNVPFPRETDRCVPSLKGVPFDEHPELSLQQVADQVIQGIQEGQEFIVANFANGDVIGHTANRTAKIECAGYVSRHLGHVLDEAKENGYVVLITADHGNLETLLTQESKPHVAHTTNPVYLILAGAGEEVQLRKGILADVAPTLLEILGITPPECMTGSSLLSGTVRSDKAMLLILDGWGKGSGNENDAIFLAETPEWDQLLAQNPHCLLQASGGAVGLQAGKAGNSEAGHLNLGAGRIVLQDDVRLDLALKDGTFAENPVFLNAIRNVKKRVGALHLISYLSHKSSHGSIDYPLALTKAAKAMGQSDIYLHIIFDGRSTAPGSAPALLAELEAQLKDIGAGQVVDGVGRGIALDRDGNWGKIKKAYEMMVVGVGAPYGG